MRRVFPSDLTLPERAVWAAFPHGECVDLCEGDSDIDDPSTARSWGQERVVRAEVLGALLLGVVDPEPGRVAVLRLRGARIVGRLDVSSSRVAVAIHFVGCRLDEQPDFSGAATRTISLTACDLDGFAGRLLRVDGNLNLDGSRVHGCVVLNHSHITGSLHLRSCRVSNPGLLAVWGGGMTVEGGMFGRELFAEGGVRLIGARLSGGLFLEAAQLSNPGSVALCLDELVAPAVLCTDGFAAHGEVQLQGAQIRSLISFDGATLRADQNALQCQRMQAGELCLTPRAIYGTADLGLAHVGILRDDAGTQSARVALDGFTYEYLRASDGTGDVIARLAWLRRNIGGYQPQPYQQLAGFYRRIGHEDDSRRVLLAKQRAHSTTLRPYARAWGHLLDWTVGHGYRPWLAGIWLLVLLGAGTAVFAAQEPRGLNPGHDPHFNPLIYSLDLLIPIGPFGLRNVFVPVGLSQWLAYALIVAGWVLATAFVAGIARVLRRD
jgi:hypothetical protein